MHAHEKLLHDFYGAFAARDPGTMAAAYADDARFSDPVFPDLDAAQVRAMWRMLIARGTDLSITFRDVFADEEVGRAHWEATYTFTTTGRVVRNSIEASFRFRDGRIVQHRDIFSLWHWAGMALGPKGWLLGWTPMVRSKVRSTAARQLAKSMAAPSKG